MLGYHRRHGIVEGRRVRPVANGARVILGEDLLPVLLHLDPNVRPHGTPHFLQDLGRRHLVRIIVVEHAEGDRLAVVAGFLQQLLGEIRIVLRGLPVLDEHGAVVFPLQALRDRRPP